MNQFSLWVCILAVGAAQASFIGFIGVPEVIRWAHFRAAVCSDVGELGCLDRYACARAEDADGSEGKQHP